ncbi:enoyl-CoA delta isomerase 2, peroxisomal [Aplysia californica]|uniref:Enoyl-CoA delta isomerase 2, peroxisomal n=1 Tax=Aplysia californica TaxID=6500 RepID=A0ABM0JS97_APLCA|nr:enoyl-CoA delta isomerase 2, peroxisomal [Aplysia californica]
MALLFRNYGQLSRRLFSKTVPSFKRCMSSSSGLDLRYNDDVAVITMRNKENRLNATFLKDFNSLLDSVEGNEACRGLITTGEGKFYGNGIELDWLSTVPVEELLTFLHDLNAFFRRVLLLPIPTMAMMNGHAFAGGAMMAAAHDLRTMNSEKGWFCFNEVFLSICLSNFFMAFLRVKLGGGKNLSDALVLGRRYTAADAIDKGIADAAFPPSSLDEESLKLLRSYIGKEGIPRAGVAKMKNHLYEGAEAVFQAEAAENFVNFSLQLMSEEQRDLHRK